MEKNEEAGNGFKTRPEPIMEWQLERRRRRDDDDDVPLLASANCLKVTAFLAIVSGFNLSFFDSFHKFGCLTV